MGERTSMEPIMGVGSHIGLGHVSIAGLHAAVVGVGEGIGLGTTRVVLG